MISRSLLPLMLLSLYACAGDDPGLTPETPAPDGASLQALPSSVEDASERTGMPQPGPSSSRFELGTHYQRLTPTQPTSSGPEEIEVAEVFRYGSRECMDFEAQFSSWELAKAGYIHLVRIPAADNPQAQMRARAFYTAESLGKLPEIHSAMYREIQLNGNDLDTEAALAELFGGFGVTAEEFAGAFNSFAVHSRLERAEELGRRYRISEVPAIVVNGKYRSTPAMAGDFQSLLDLVDYLAALENAGD